MVHDPARGRSRLDRLPCADRGGVSGTGPDAALRVRQRDLEPGLPRFPRPDGGGRVGTLLGGGDDYLGLQLRGRRGHAAAMAVVGSEFASAGRGFVRVLAGQAANAWVLEQRLAAEGALAATDEIAIAPLSGHPRVSPFDPEAARIIARWSEAELFAALARAQSQEVDGWIAAHVALAAAKGRRLVSHEGGQHFGGDSGNDALTALFTAANRASAMGVAMRRTWTGGATRRGTPSSCISPTSVLPRAGVPGAPWSSRSRGRARSMTP